MAVRNSEKSVENEIEIELKNQDHTVDKAFLGIITDSVDITSQIHNMKIFSPTHFNESVDNLSYKDKQFEENGPPQIIDSNLHVNSP